MFPFKKNLKRKRKKSVALALNRIKTSVTGILPTNYLLQTKNKIDKIYLCQNNEILHPIGYV